MNFESPNHLVFPSTIHIQPLTPILFNKNDDASSTRPQSNRTLSISSSSEDDDNLSLHDNSSERSATPPSPCPSTCNNNNYNYYNKSLSYFSNDYLNFIEPHPVSPPTYDTLPPGGCPKFPVSAAPIFSFSSENNNNNISLSPPAYKPAIYKIGVVARKVEWINNQELSPNRSWKYYIIELNSTQLNFYQIPSRYETQVVNYRPKLLQRELPVKHLDSIFTSEDDFGFYNMVKGFGLLTNNNRKKVKTLSGSYSLQNAKIGLATDYKKRPNVLRLRIEDEQLLLNFSTIQEVINWNLSINVGKDVAIDITDRELPRYRTVPRRRRRRNNRDGNGSSIINNVLHNNNSLARLRSASDPNRFKDKFSRLRLKLSSSSSSSNRSSNKNTQEPSPISSGNNSVENSPTPTESPSITRASSAPNLIDALEEQLMQTDIHQRDEDEEEEEEDEEFDHVSLSSIDNSRQDEEDVDSCSKWCPQEKKFDLRKYHRDCLRCIKPLYYS
ncbi:hypothetical protein SBY92_002976 [Candida maltosa Xu316]